MKWVAAGWAQWIPVPKEALSPIGGLNERADTPSMGRLFLPCGIEAVRYSAFPWVVEDYATKLPILLGTPFLAGYKVSLDFGTGHASIFGQDDIGFQIH